MQYSFSWRKDILVVRTVQLMTKHRDLTAMVLWIRTIACKEHFKVINALVTINSHCKFCTSMAIWCSKQVNNQPAAASKLAKPSRQSGRLICTSTFGSLCKCSHTRLRCSFALWGAIAWDFCCGRASLTADRCLDAVMLKQKKARLQLESYLLTMGCADVWLLARRSIPLYPRGFLHMHHHGSDDSATIEEYQIAVDTSPISASMGKSSAKPSLWQHWQYRQIQTLPWIWQQC